jgi:hypothetical protein
MVLLDGHKIAILEHSREFWDLQPVVTAPGSPGPRGSRGWRTDDFGIRNYLWRE